MDVEGKSPDKEAVSEDASLKKCLEGNKGDIDKCKSLLEAFKNSSSSSAAAAQKQKALAPLMLRSGSLTDV
ncbi:unnamed protein product [Cuscuta campestris]|uniref:Uncharacterized protein n=2 Tax=Cuscuta sect. Cleistogrammica TaxID=1824901 RepID=A0A484LEC3_9ASTE|nr:hypothetical protein DM860_004623 [Cuscuta australis]VFQ74743.1 unnamed protein product [Cuscuta campestris]